jgi:hypothetical protein
LRTKEELEAGALHVNYELQMMVKCAIEHNRFMAATTSSGPNGDNPNPAVLQHATLEAMLIHARNLIEFLVVREPDSRGMHAMDFVVDWQAPTKATMKSVRDAAARLCNERRSINEHLAHLSWARVEPIDKDWKFEQLVGDVLTVFDDVVRQPDKAKSPAVSTLQAALQQAPAEHGGFGSSVVSSKTSSDGVVWAVDFGPPSGRAR